MMMTSAAVLVGTVVATVGGASSIPKPRLDTLNCGATTMQPGERVVVQTPNFPKNYNVNDRCQYEITCNPMASTYLEFKCPVFELEASADCKKDQLVVASHGSRETYIPSFKML